MIDHSIQAPANLYLLALHDPHLAKLCLSGLHAFASSALVFGGAPTPSSRVGCKDQTYTCAIRMGL
jgi:hypothetical protein